MAESSSTCPVTFAVTDIARPGMLVDGLHINDVPILDVIVDRIQFC